MIFMIKSQKKVFVIFVPPLHNSGVTPRLGLTNFHLKFLWSAACLFLWILMEYLQHRLSGTSLSKLSKDQDYLIKILLKNA